MKNIKKTPPLVSVLIPVYNAQKYLQTAIKSILNQSFRDFEIIAIDDGSSDDSFKILKNLAKKDKRIRVFQNDGNHNIAFTLNRAVKLARGKYLARMDGDDIAIHNRLKRQVRYLNQHPNTVVVGSNCHTIDQDNNLLGQKRFPLSNVDIRSVLFLINPMQHPTMMINKTLLPKNFAWYNENLPPAEDLDLLFRLATYGNVHNLRKPLLFYRLHLQSETFKNPRATYEVTKRVRLRALNIYGYQRPAYLRLVNKIQEVLISVLPAKAIYFIYNSLRSITSLLSERHTKKIAQTQEELQTLLAKC